MAAIPTEARQLFEDKEVAHVPTVNADGSSPAFAVWIAHEDANADIDTLAKALPRRLALPSRQPGEQRVLVKISHGAG
jgi:hypothetical protein